MWESLLRNAQVLSTCLYTCYAQDKWKPKHCFTFCKHVELAVDFATDSHHRLGRFRVGFVWGVWGRVGFDDFEQHL